MGKAYTPTEASASTSSPIAKGMPGGNTMTHGPTAPVHGGLRNPAALHTPGAGRQAINSYGSSVSVHTVHMA